MFIVALIFKNFKKTRIHCILLLQLFELVCPIHKRNSTEKHKMMNLVVDKLYF